MALGLCRKVGTHPELPKAEAWQCPRVGPVRSRGESVTRTPVTSLPGTEEALKGCREGVKNNSWVSVGGHTVTCYCTFLTTIRMI